MLRPSLALRFALPREGAVLLYHALRAGLVKASEPVHRKTEDIFARGVGHIIHPRPRLQRGVHVRGNHFGSKKRSALKLARRRNRFSQMQ
jgi:hypothetical protein